MSKYSIREQLYNTTSKHWEENIFITFITFINAITYSKMPKKCIILRIIRSHVIVLKQFKKTKVIFSITDNPFNH